MSQRPATVREIVPVARLTVFAPFSACTCHCHVSAEERAHDYRHLSIAFWAPGVSVPAAGVKWDNFHADPHESNKPIEDAFGAYCAFAGRAA